ncbi:hypothetical protein [Vulcanisaeta thermophila]|uniref:hypothetical protein n=1 Tax=Vulcanisaeta thermophila TaxID=867917 RepID=UPI000853B436|nr:hypothetical protein [Vulcanisaeta thermophila]
MASHARFYPDYETYIPREVVLDDERRVIVLQDEPLKDNVFLLYVPPQVTRELCSHMRRVGFKEAFPAVLKTSPMGKPELCSMAKRLADPWELNVRVYEDGFIEGEVEVGRDYLENLGGNR